MKKQTHSRRSNRSHAKPSRASRIHTKAVDIIDDSFDSMATAADDAISYIESMVGMKLRNREVWA
ncbi:MAG: hypothetical protein SGI71_02420 [Verrucomicrobiota bacterium]|nr:hypothetical protein [Verrucomicrobiota bacterium]